MKPDAFSKKFRQALLIKLKQENSPIWNRFIQLFPEPYQVITKITEIGPMAQLIDHIFSEMSLCNENISYLYSQFENTSFFKLLIDTYYNQISMALYQTTVENSQRCLDYVLQLSAQIEPQPAFAEMQMYWLEHFSPQDQRTYTEGRDENIKLRRLDSLARLLSLQSQYSVCTAVTFFNDQLVIGANVSSEKEEATVQNALVDRLTQIRQVTHQLQCLLVDKYGPTWRKHADISVLMPAAIHFTLQLIQPFGISVRRDEFVQALYKWFDAMLLDDDTFSALEKNCALERPPLILTPISMKADPIFHTMYSSDFHGEQLIVYYTDNNGRLTENTPMGISKLSCETCHNALRPLSEGIPHFIISGSHGQTFSRTVNVRTGQQAPMTPKKMAPLIAKTSPQETPDERRRKRPRTISPMRPIEYEPEDERTPLARHGIFIGKTASSSAPRSDTDQHPKGRAHSPS
ncbi:MAG: hypothetical protein NTW08_04360 [Gammaproteobacteria bacterium]|nr:hypothetical protein [Gammaproteobacteria bacterium]